MVARQLDCGTRNRDMGSQNLGSAQSRRVIGIPGVDVILRHDSSGKASGTIDTVIPAPPYNTTTEEYKRIVAKFF
jgi:hypothetical protein